MLYRAGQRLVSLLYDVFAFLFGAPCISLLCFLYMLQAKWKCFSSWQVYVRCPDFSHTVSSPSSSIYGMQYLPWELTACSGATVLAHRFLTVGPGCKPQPILNRQVCQSFILNVGQTFLPAVNDALYERAIIKLSISIIGSSTQTVYARNSSS